MRVVKQESGNDCMIACVAMVTGESIHAMLNLGRDLETSPPPWNDEDAVRVLSNMGYFALNSTVWPCTKHGRADAIVTVASANYVRRLHALVCFEDKIYDPSLEQIYTDVDTLPWSSVILVWR